MDPARRLLRAAHRFRASGPITLSSTTTAPVNRQPAHCNSIIRLPYPVAVRPLLSLSTSVVCVAGVLRNIYSPSKRPRPSDKIDCTINGIDFRLPARRLHRSSPTAGGGRIAALIGFYFSSKSIGTSPHTHTQRPLCSIRIIRRECYIIIHVGIIMFLKRRFQYFFFSLSF